MLFSFSCLAYSLDGAFHFENIFFQLIKRGNATLQIFNDAIINSIEFGATTKRYSARMARKRGKIELINENGLYTKYDCDIIDSDDSIIIRIERLNIDLTINILHYDNTIWYSCPISSEYINNLKIHKPGVSDTEFINFIGVMEKNE
jgi:hypothetical protein